MTGSSPLGPSDVSAVVCTYNSGASIEDCIESLRANGVGEVIVVDASSTDGTRQIAERYSDLLLTDPRQGLGMARNLGIAASSRPLILNAGSDNVFPAGSLSGLVEHLGRSGCTGVGAITRVVGNRYLARAMDSYRSARFKPGPVSVIGTPTLFRGEVLRAHPFDVGRRFSDDSELCDRLRSELGAAFEIAPVSVGEVGKASFREVVSRCRIYGESDDENFRAGAAAGWTRRRKVQSLLHPARVDLVQPLRAMKAKDRLTFSPFLVGICALRYLGWLRAARASAVSE